MLLGHEMKMIPSKNLCLLPLSFALIFARTPYMISFRDRGHHVHLWVRMVMLQRICHL